MRRSTTPRHSTKVAFSVFLFPSLFWEQLFWQVGRTYYFSKGTLKQRNAMFNHSKAQYELTLTKDSTIVPCVDDGTIKDMAWDFRTLEVTEPTVQIAS